ncbi:hypothetical protein ACFQ0Q_16990 [Streptomyces aureus]
MPDGVTSYTDSGAACGAAAEGTVARCTGIRSSAATAVAGTAEGRDFGRGTVSATRRPRPSAARAMIATPRPELVCDNSSMASVEKITVAEP